MPLSIISRSRSLPSRVRSPTPAKTERPLWPLAMLFMSSWMSTVLPTPAPPKRPILPPLAYGSIRSMTLMPVNRTSASVVSSSYDGAGLCMGLPPSFVGFGMPSIDSPITFSRRPRALSPLGIMIGAPVLTTSMPRFRPSVDSMAMHLTVFSPMCCSHSITSLAPLSRVISRASYISGSSPSVVSNATSTTGPTI